MRSTSRQLSLALLSIVLVAACRKSTKEMNANTLGYTGTWQMTQLIAPPNANTVPVDKDHVYELKLNADSTRQDIYNGNVIDKGTWSVRSKDSAGIHFDLLIYGGSGNYPPVVYLATMLPDQLVLKSYPDSGNMAVFIRK